MSAADANAGPGPEQQRGGRRLRDGRGTRGGRRPGNSRTREQILAAARARFAESGFDRASVRSIAADAAVDPALVHHYFGTKRNLFAAALALPVDPETVLAQVRAVPVDEIARAVLRAVVGLWDSPQGSAVVGAFRGVLGGGDPQLIRSFILEVALKEVRGRVDAPPGSADVRVSLAASHMIGILVARRILEIEPLASMPLGELVERCAPQIQHYLTGPFEA
ncbi:TetR family transcriptional regulator [Tomitella cavernea]|uniref:TetR/AcrR family transcriptional regulator n=1 Tax=Tomitella cavernea TaxID=1387982 RepID=UPI0027DD4E1C|nr:TetR family transcriptional regulator [Tomitella cavernea]